MWNSVNRGTTLGLLMLATTVALLAMWAAALPWCQRYGISPLLIALLGGLGLGQVLRPRLRPTGDPAIRFLGKTVLRGAIVLYGLRLSVQEIAQIGVPGMTVAVGMVVTTLLFGTYLGVRLFRLDRETALLSSAGSAICGAAAVMATESVLRSASNKSVIAVSNVVIFGTLSMLIYPLLFSQGLFGGDEALFGVYVGGTVHEVAQVMAVGNSIGVVASDNAIVVKMTRVLLLVPFLALLSWRLQGTTGTTGRRGGLLQHVPWFAAGFLAVVVINSLQVLPDTLRAPLLTADLFLLTIAMFALGLDTHWTTVRQAGLRPFYHAAAMFLWLVCGGFLITWLCSGGVLQS